MIGDNMIDQSIITNISNGIKNLISNEISEHSNTTANSSTKGHVQAGGVPQNVSTTASAGTDNGCYARADHVHKASFNNLADKPTTFTPSAHTHTINNITNLQSTLNDKADEEHSHSQEDVSFVGSTEIWQGLGSNKNIGQAVEYVMWFFENHNHFREIYPVGSIYLSVNNTNPSTLFGGTWEQIKDKFLLASGDTYSNGATGGSADSVVVSHNHTQNSHNHTQNAHKHGTGSSSLTSFLITNKNIAVNGDSRTWPSKASSTLHLVYAPDGGSIEEAVGTANTTATNNATTATNNAVGESGSGKNMPPYLVVNIWRRTS